MVAKGRPLHLSLQLLHSSAVWSHLPPFKRKGTLRRLHWKLFFCVYFGLENPQTENQNSMVIKKKASHLCVWLQHWPWLKYKKQKNLTEQTTAPDVLTFHVLISWHWLSIVCVCVCVCVCVSSLLANNAAQEVCQDKGPDCEALFWSVRPTFEGDNNRFLLIPEKPTRCRREPWIREKGITAPGVFKARAGDVPLAGECCCNMSCFNRGWSKSRSHLQVRPPTEELSGGFACFEVINMQLHFMLLQDRKSVV